MKIKKLDNLLSYDRYVFLNFSDVIIIIIVGKIKLITEFKLNVIGFS